MPLSWVSHTHSIPFHPNQERNIIHRMELLKRTIKVKHIVLVGSPMGQYANTTHLLVN